MYIIRSDAGQPLREELAKSPKKILLNAFPEFLPTSDDASMTPGALNPSAAMTCDEALITPQPESSVPPSSSPSATSDAYFQGLALVSTMVKLMPGWLQSNRIVFDTLVLVWKSPARITRLNNEQELNLVQVSLSIIYSLQNIDWLCCILHIFHASTSDAYTYFFRSVQ